MTSIDVEPNSLYITTVPLVQEGQFHWALIHIDAAGVATKYQWGAFGNLEGPEHYDRMTLTYGCRSKTGALQILAYYKIANFAPPLSETMHTACSNVFPYSYNTAQQNRSHGISCRTFVHGVLRQMLSDKRAQGIHDTVFQHSTACRDAFGNSLFWGGSYECQVLSI
jgi:hypothetical protein